MIWALVVAIGIDAQGPFLQSATSSTQVMSPTVVASWYVEREPNQPNRLQLVVLWRGAPASMPSARFAAAAAEDMQNDCIRAVSRLNPPETRDDGRLRPAMMPAQTIHLTGGSAAW